MLAESQLRLMQLISPTLPIGSFAYSQGLEYAVDTGWVNNEEKAGQWIKGQIKNTLTSLDIPVMQRLYHAWQSNDLETVIYWNAWLLAAREAKELRDEDNQLGQALLRLINDLEMKFPVTDDIEWSYAAIFSYAAKTWNIPAEEMANGFLWAWCENQVAAAVKLIPLGQTAGQRILSDVLKDIPKAVEKTINVSDEDIGMLAPGIAIASALHETQYSRLFRS
ncbi:MAG: urease accessory protein UreF [Gammaproteobacteria bacterium]|nr:urease accessory protein UreF [Gammaproteobacteria bacterium]